MTSSPVWGANDVIDRRGGNDLICGGATATTESMAGLALTASAAVPAPTQPSSPAPREGPINLGTGAASGEAAGVSLECCRRRSTRRQQDTALPRARVCP